MLIAVEPSPKGNYRVMFLKFFLVMIPRFTWTQKSNKVFRHIAVTVADQLCHAATKLVSSIDNASYISNDNAKKGKVSFFIGTSTAGRQDENFDSPGPSIVFEHLEPLILNDV